MLNILNSLPRSGSSLPSFLLRAAATSNHFPFTQCLRDAAHKQPSLALQGHKFRQMRSFSTDLVRSNKFPDEIVNVPWPEFAYVRKTPPIMSRIDLANLPSPSGPLDTGVLGVILDWAGTLVDYGVFSPQVVYYNLFEKFGVPITMDEAKAPMGKHKLRHLRDIFELDIEPDLHPVRERWKEKYGVYPDDKTAEEMFEHFPRMQLACLEEYSTPIVGVAETLHNIDKMGWKTTTTTGFLTGMSIFLTQIADKIGKIDFPCDAQQVPYGRPMPEMPLLGLARAKIPPSYAVKVGDTQGDDQEGMDANVWVVALVDTNTYVNKTHDELNELAKNNPEELEKLRKLGFKKHTEKQPHFIIDGIWNLFPVLRQIDLLCKSGFHPYHFKPTDTSDPNSLYQPAKIPGYMNFPHKQ